MVQVEIGLRKGACAIAADVNQARASELLTASESAQLRLNAGWVRVTRLNTAAEEKSAPRRCQALAHLLLCGCEIADCLALECGDGATVVGEPAKPQ